MRIQTVLQKLGMKSLLLKNAVQGETGVPSGILILEHAICVAVSWPFSIIIIYEVEVVVEYGNALIALFFNT